MDHQALVAAVAQEIERQNANVNYDVMDAEELELMVERLQAKLDLCKTELESRAAQGTKKKEAPKMVAAKAEKGDWPELPWGGARADHEPHCRSQLTRE